MTQTVAEGGSPQGCLGVMAVFLILMAPVYLLFRFFVRLVRQAYGFEPVPEDDGPPLRICYHCNNTVMEDDFAHCPYCGAALEPVPAPAPGPPTAQEAPADEPPA